MEELYAYILQFAVFPIAIVCWGVGYVIKQYIPKIPNKFIPLILGCLGLVINLCLNNFAFTVEIIITGIASGLAATGSYELVRNLKDKKKEVVTDERTNSIDN